MVSKTTEMLFAEMGIERQNGEWVMHPLPSVRERMASDLRNIGRDMYNALEKRYGKASRT